MPRIKKFKPLKISQMGKLSGKQKKARYGAMRGKSTRRY